MIIRRQRSGYGALPTDDNAFGFESMRIDDRAALPAYLLDVKTPAENKRSWDYQQD